MKNISIMLIIMFLFACQSVGAEGDLPPEPNDEMYEESPEGVRMARDAVLVYLESTRGIDGLPVQTDWETSYITQPNIVGQSAYQFIAGAWMVAVSYPVVAPENVIYTVQVTNPMQTFMWAGTVLPDGMVRELPDSEAIE